LAMLIPYPWLAYCKVNPRIFSFFLIIYIYIYICASYCFCDH
jgi:hypothetical protein